MKRNQEILAISRVVFALTKLGDHDLDQMLEQLYQLLGMLPGIQVLPQSLILLANDKGNLVQIAQHGLPPVWDDSMLPSQSIALQKTAQSAVLLGQLQDYYPALPVAERTAGQPCFILNLDISAQCRGQAILFIAPGWQPDAVEQLFMSDLAQALSVLVARCIINETLRVREVELESARTEAIRRLGSAAEYRDNETGMHIMRMTHFATAIAKAMGLPAESRELLGICAPMHDVGKIGIPDAILLKPGKLTGDEFTVMKDHTVIGQRLLTGEDKLIQTARDIAASHHERWDGDGYPEGKKGEEIPLLARICTVSDVFDALTSVRPYKPAWPLEEAIAWIRQHAGSQFDPQVVAAFDLALPDILRIRQLYRDDIIDPNQTLDLPDPLPVNHQWVAWSDDLSVGIDVIDEHHRYLFDLTNDLFEVISNKRGVREVARVMKALDQYVAVHFRAEERMMEHYQYGRQQQQEHQHAEFEEKLRSFYDALHTNPLTAQIDVLVYLRRWLVNHILHEDAGLRELVHTTGGTDSDLTAEEAV